jgi:hypothetical protein
MPLLTRITIRLAMLYLILGLAGWLLYWTDITWQFSVNWSALKPISIHFITVGWLTQFIFAVIFWMFPIISREKPRGKEWIAWFGCITLNAGLILRAIFEFTLSKGMLEEAKWGLIIAGLLQWIGATAWIIVNWGRIREKGKSR